MHTNVGETAHVPAPTAEPAPASAPAPALPPQMHTNIAETGHAPEPEPAHVPAPETVSAPALAPKLQIYSSLPEKKVSRIFFFFSVLCILNSMGAEKIRLPCQTLPSAITGVEL